MNLPLGRNISGDKRCMNEKIKTVFCLPESMATSRLKNISVQHTWPVMNTLNKYYTFVWKVTCDYATQYASKNLSPFLYYLFSVILFPYKAHYDGSPTG